MEHLDHYDRAIIHFLGIRGESNTNEVAEKLRIGWATAAQHLERLRAMKYVVAAKRGKIINWRLWEY